jgi:Holliday junction resolvase
MGKGRDFENELAKGIDRATHDSVRCFPCGYSGSNPFPSPDNIILSRDGVYGLELKKTSSSDYFYIDYADIEQLLTCGNNYTDVGFVFNWSHREPTCFMINGHTAMTIDGDVSETKRIIKNSCPKQWDPQFTDTDTLRISKPSLDNWQSASAGRNATEVVVGTLGLKRDFVTDATTV